MKRIFSKEKSRKEKKADFYILYTIVFAAISLFIYSCFYFNGKSLIWSHDGVPQHINALAYYGKYLRNVLQTLVTEHKLSLPMWDMHIGYGSDILTTLHYYVIGDPLTLLSVFVPEKDTEILYELLIFLRIYLAGITFSIYCFYRKNPKQATFLGSLVYIFAGWTIYASMKHPYFSNPMIYLPLVLMGIEKIYKKEKPYLFICATAVAAMSNFYFFYMISIFMVLYAAFRYFGIFRKRSVKDVFQWFLKFAGFYLVALMIAALIFLPVVMTLFGTERFQAQNYVPLLYDRIYYEKYLGCLIGENMIQWGVAGYSAVAMAGVFVIFSKEKIYGTEAGLCASESVFADPLCRSCTEWIFIRVQPMDLGVWNADRIYPGTGISGTVYAGHQGETTDICDAADIWRAGTVFRIRPHGTQYHGTDDAGPGCVYSGFLRKRIYTGKISLWNDRGRACDKHPSECFISVFLRKRLSVRI